MPCYVTLCLSMRYYAALCLYYVILCLICSLHLPSYAKLGIYILSAGSSHWRVKKVLLLVLAYSPT